MNTKKCGIAIDGWKLEHFKKGLEEAGHKYVVRGKKGDALICIQVDVPVNEVLTSFRALIEKLNRGTGN